jgi:hypothetical protein
MSGVAARHLYFLNLRAFGQPAPQLCHAFTRAHQFNLGQPHLLALGEILSRLSAD